MTIILGTNGDDVIQGTDFDDVINSLDGNDIVFSGKGDDWTVRSQGVISLPLLTHLTLPLLDQARFLGTVFFQG